MITLTVAASLASLTSPGSSDRTTATRTLELEAGDWTQLVDGLRRRFPRLADHVLAPSGVLRPGFLLTVNDAAVTSGGRQAPLVRAGDSVLLFPQIAGG